MNSISLQNISVYNRFTYAHIAVDGVPLPHYINRWTKASDSDTLKNAIFSGSWGAEELCCAWASDLDFDYCNRFMTELLYSHKDMTVPLLLCDDDRDFSCTVITADIRFSGETVYMDRISLFNRTNNMNELGFGIAYSDSYTEDDWKMWGELGCPYKLWEVGSSVWTEWVKANWENEGMRRLKNYFFPEYQKKENLLTIGEPYWQFDRTQYDKIIDFYQSGNFRNAEIPNELKG